jgi:hypothetical protein
MPETDVAAPFFLVAAQCQETTVFFDMGLKPKMMSNWG